MNILYTDVNNGKSGWVLNRRHEVAS